ncbi:hypothetical protein G5B00_13765 [Parapedobacter sp. SGR-10]|uniref:hypothetical protein n=1 Tax=Parapedobacter sp. SGR-10 TaxID=2710879 RepID=UPI0013D1A77F|nr:hypothetical protein [Parapedobacter sp. SGR-10]NGF57581.1 hypothetical protein [Parapedobacter sp. SGR-10]
MKNNFIVGVLLGSVFPVLAYLLTTYTELQKTFFEQKPITIYVLAAVVNLIAVRFIYRSGRENTAKGIVLVTFLAMVLMVFVLRIKV